MKNLKKIATTMALAGIIMMGVTSAQAGLLMSDFMGGTTEQPCTDKLDEGIIVNDIVGIIVSGLTGIIVNDFSPNTCENVNHGILMSD
jgi:hypothetical protein